MILYIPSTTKYCIQDVNTKEYLIGNITSNCSDLCFQENVIIDQYNKRCICNENYKFEYNSQCYKKCPNSLLQIKTDKYICSSTAPRNYYLDNDDNIYKQCYTICKQCSKAGNSSNHNCDVCEEGYTFINDTVATKNNCYQICSIYYYFSFSSYSNKYYYYCVNTCPTTYNKIIEPKKRCIDDCKKDEEYIYEYNNKCYKVCPINKKTYEEEKICLDSCYDAQFEYNNICYNDCPTGTYRLFKNRNICVEIVPEDYFLDIDNIYKKCYHTCKKCSQIGDETINNCIECKDNYTFLNDSFVHPSNCYEDCQFFYYFDESNEYHCVNPCPSGFEKYIPQRRKCIDYCQRDDYYIFEYDNICLSQCPINLKIDEKTKLCLESCYINQFEFENICYYDFPENKNEFFQNGIIYINNIENFENMLYKIIFPSYPPAVGNKILIIRPDNKSFEITNSINELDLLKNKSGNIWGLSIIDLGQCESLLKKENNINENDSLIFIKNEINSTKASEKNVKIDVYNPYTKEKLNLSLCEEIPVNIYMPMELNSGTKKLYDETKNSGYDMFNINDPFYQDICTPFNSNGTDILLIDRIDYIYFNEDTKCQSNCQYNKYSMESKYLTCSCSVNEEVNNEHKKSDKFNAKKIYESFYDVLRYSNYDIIKCYKIILSLDVITINLGSIITIFFFSCCLICLFVFTFRGIIPIRIKLRNDLYKDKKAYNLFVKFNIDKLLFPPIKKNIGNKIVLKNNIQNSKKIIFKKKINLNNQHNQIKYDYKQHIHPSWSSRSDANFKPPNEKLKDLKIKASNKFNEKIGGKISKREYSDYELNQLEYERAIKLDKRTLCQIYKAILKREHLIIFTCFNCNDYNLLSVKVSRCIFLFVGDMALNVFFFSDDSTSNSLFNYYITNNRSIFMLFKFNRYIYLPN